MTLRVVDIDGGGGKPLDDLCLHGDDMAAVHVELVVEGGQTPGGFLVCRNFQRGRAKSPAQHTVVRTDS